MKIRTNSPASDGCQRRIVRRWAILKANGQPLLHSFATTEKRAWDMVIAKARKHLPGLEGIAMGIYTKRELKAAGLRAAKCEIHVPNTKASDR